MMPTREEILKMPAGSEIELLISDHVLKLSTLEWNRRFFNNRTKFSTDIAAAWEVVEKMREKFGYRIFNDVSSKIGQCTTANFYNNRIPDKISVYVSAETAPLAICRAALLAVQSASPTHDLP